MACNPSSYESGKVEKTSTRFQILGAPYRQKTKLAQEENSKTCANVSLRYNNRALQLAYGPVAQRWSRGLIILWLSVRIRPGPPFISRDRRSLCLAQSPASVHPFDLMKKVQIGGCQTATVRVLFFLALEAQTNGRLAQRERTSFTRKGSQVQIL